MKEYSPKRRTALVLTGSGTAGAYHAGVLKALDESGVKVDLVVGSGVGTVAAALFAVAGAGKLHGKGGFWDGLGFRSLYRARLALRTGLGLLALAYAVFLLPLLLALLAGLLFPLLLIADVLSPGLPARLLGGLASAPALLRGPYLAALAAPVFALSVVFTVALARLWLRDRRRLAEAFEAPLDARRAAERLARALWQVVRGPLPQVVPPSEAELSQRYVSMASENLGQPGFRELILLAADLDTGGALPFVLLQDAHRASFAAARGRGARSWVEGIPDTVDLRAAGCETLLFDAVAAGLLPPLVVPTRRVSFLKAGPYPGETHRLADGTLAAGCGLSAALAAGAEQVVLVSATPEEPSLPARRRGPRAQADGVLAVLERQALERDVAAAERINRMVETLGHEEEGGGRAWQDPATGRLYRSFPLYVVRPARRGLGPLELDGARDPASEVLETLDDLIERGYRDAYRLFVEPIVGAAPEPRRALREQEGQPVEL